MDRLMETIQAANVETVRQQLDALARRDESAHQVLLICKFAFAATLAYLPHEENETRKDVFHARACIDAWLAGHELPQR